MSQLGAYKRLLQQLGRRTFNGCPGLQALPIKALMPNLSDIYFRLKHLVNGFTPEVISWVGEA